MKLRNYLKTIDYKHAYDKLIATSETQSVENDNVNIILYCLSDDILVEVSTKACSSMQLLSIISHKIRNPLTNIIGALTFIDDLKVQPIQKKNVDILKKASYEIVGVVNDIIDIINLHSSSIELDLMKTSIAKIFQDCNDIVIKEITSKNINIKFVIDRNIPEIVLVDITRLKQIIINLINNSIHNMTIGGIIVEAELMEESATKHHGKNTYNILFSIKDTGTGVDPAIKNYLEKILEIDNTENETYKYGGMGLIISKYLCNLMGGRIWFKSEQNIGTVFYFNILCTALMTN